MTQGHPYSHSSHRRTTSSTNASKVSTRSSRPALHRRGTSFVNPSISKLGSGSGHSRWSEREDDKQPEMAASFLNFCAMCEKQITVPDNSLLYCSESCRRKDSSKPLSASLPATASMAPSTTPPSSPPMSPRTIVAPMIPTRAPARAISVTRIPSDLHEAKTDLDPTEWKPVIPMRPGISTSLASSEAWQYLSRFHGGDETMLPAPRAGAGHRSTASLSTLMSATGAMPSLTDTPSTVASSFSSNASDYMSYMHDLPQRPLPPRHNPYFSNSASATKGVELVVPHVVTSSEDTVTVNIADRGSIFPASSALWADSPYEKTPTPVINIVPAACDVTNTQRA